MILGIVGTRTFKDYEYLKKKILENFSIDTIEEIVTGSYKKDGKGNSIGADTFAVDFAREYNIPYIIYYPDWKGFGKLAGFLRNTSIVERSDTIVAFWNGKSRGTKDSIDKAKIAHKHLLVFDIY